VPGAFNGEVPLGVRPQGPYLLGAPVQLPAGVGQHRAGAQLVEQPALPVHPSGQCPACPVTEDGNCLIQIVRNDPRVARAEGKEVYSPREVHLLRKLASFMRTAPAERVRAIEILIEELIGKPGH